jgi:hypothetical protein
MKEQLPDIALSVRQPWAWAIIHATPPKDIENRGLFAKKWLSYLKGLQRVCIHAATGMTREEYEIAADYMARIGVSCPPPADLVRGAIIGTVQISTIVTTSESRWFSGPCGLVLRAPAPCEPEPAIGALGLFDWRKASSHTVPVLRAPLPWMLKWQPGSTRCCDQIGEVCGLPRGHNLVLPQPHRCLSCGHASECHNEPSAILEANNHAPNHS